MMYRLIRNKIDWLIDWLMWCWSFQRISMHPLLSAISGNLISISSMRILNSCSLIVDAGGWSKCITIHFMALFAKKRGYKQRFIIHFFCEMKSSLVVPHIGMFIVLPCSNVFHTTDKCINICSFNSSLLGKIILSFHRLYQHTSSTLKMKYCWMQVNIYL